MIKLILTCIFSLAFTLTVFSEEAGDSATNRSLVYEKLYLHIDREIYSPGDDIWFKSYLVSGINHQLIPGYKNIYVQLISEDGEIVDSCLMLSLNGVAANDFHLADSLRDGTYVIRAYTKYLLNFGEESLFHQKIAVAHADDTPNIEPDKNSTHKIDVSFLPQGGNLVLNASNRVAFKAIDETGRGVAVSGKVVNQDGAEIATFETTYKGMGQFMLMPVEGKSYFAKLDDYPGFSYQFPEAKEKGIALHFQPKGTNLQFILNRNFKIQQPQKLILKASHKNVELFRKEFEMKGFQYPVEIFKGDFPLGISKVTVLDVYNNKLAERLVFVRNAGAETLEVATDRRNYTTRDEVELDISALIAEDSIETSLSVAVVNEDYFNAEGNNQTIESYLLLDSELKGQLESPAGFFTNDEGITADEKLDLAMQVNGWRRYYWDELETFAGEKLHNWSDIGLSLNGRVRRLLSDKPVAKGIVKAGPFSGSFLIERDTTDEAGRFSIDRLYLKDSAQIMINATRKNGGNAVEIIYEPTMLFDTAFSHKQVKNRAANVWIPDRFYRVNYYKQLAERRFDLEQESILLDDIDIIRKKKETDGHYRLYGEPDHSFEITDDDWTYSNVLDYLEGRAAGVVVTGEEVRIRSASRNPLLLVDGLETEWESILNLAMGDIDKIEVLKSTFSTVIYGSKGADGVISILTRTGDGAFENEFVRDVRGRITPTVRGFSQSSEFYSPKYPLNKLNELENRKPDYRPTMYWNPDVNFETGNAALGFFTSDMLGKYRVIVEGISKKGVICYGTSSFEVTVQNESESD